MKQITADDIKEYVKNNPKVEFGGMSESLAQMVNYFILKIASEQEVSE
jgi:hypothetical protein